MIQLDRKQHPPLFSAISCENYNLIVNSEIFTLNFASKNAT